MRIAMLTNNYKPFVGGVPISVERLAEGLRKLGHIVYVFAPTYENQVEEEFIIRYKSLSHKVGGGKVVCPNALDSIIGRKFRALDFDIIHVHHPMLMGQVAQYMGNKYRIPVVFTYHTRVEQYLHYFKPIGILEERYKKERNRKLKELEGDILSVLKDKVTPGAINLFANRCELIFAPTELMKEYLNEKRTKTRIQVMPTGLDSKYFIENKEKSSEMRNKYIGDKKYLFCTVSRLAKEKNIEFIIKGIKSIKGKIGNIFKVLIIGEGPEYKRLYELAKNLNVEENIVFLGAISNDKIGDYYRACDLFLFASKSETQGIVLLEAMAARNPIVAIEASGVVEVVKNDVNGYMTDESIEEWSDCVCKIVGDDKLRIELGERAYNTAKLYIDSNIFSI